jgi:hypothetical protein
MPVPFSRRSGRQVGRHTCGTKKRLRTTDSDPDGIWLTNADSSAQALIVQFLSNRRKILREKTLFVAVPAQVPHEESALTDSIDSPLLSDGASALSYPRQ